MDDSKHMISTEVSFALVTKRKRPFSFSAVASSGSMLPLIEIGDVLFFAPIPYQQLKEGDIVASSHELKKKIIVHRLVEKHAHSYSTKSDLTWQCDPTWQRSQYLAKLTRVENKRWRFNCDWRTRFFSWSLPSAFTASTVCSRAEFRTKQYLKRMLYRFNKR